MSTYTASLSADTADEVIGRIVARLIRDFGGLPQSIAWDGATLTLDHPAVIANFADIVRAAKGGLLTPAERNALEDEIDGLRTYFGLASPTNAQSVAAIKAIIAVLRAVLRD